MDRRRFLKTGILGGLGALAAPMLNLGRCRLLAAGAAAVEVSTRAADLVLGSPVVDMLGLLTLDWRKLFRWQRSPAEFAEADYRGLEVAGIDVFHPAVEPSQPDARAAALRWIAGWNHLLDAHACFLGRVANAADLARVPRQGKLGVIVGFQNADHFASAADVELFHGLGQRVSQLTYNERNRLGSGCYERRDRGLTRFGAEIVAAMNRAGMAIDVSHCGERTGREAIAASRRPVLVTHANCKALVPWQPRCKSDTLIKAMARKGGVMGITVVRAFVGARPRLADLLDHFEHVARLVGVEHVGLGSDLDVASGASAFYTIGGLDPAARVFQIADGLLSRRFSQRAVQLVLGGNFARALGEIWGPAPPSARDGVAARAARRDPFCPAPHPTVPGAARR